MASLLAWRHISVQAEAAVLVAQSAWASAEAVAAGDREAHLQVGRGFLD